MNQRKPIRLAQVEHDWTRASTPLWRFKPPMHKLIPNPFLLLVFVALTVPAGLLHTAQAQAHNLHGSGAPEFEVATIKPSTPDGGTTNFSLAPDRFSVTNASLTELIQFAYNINSKKQLPTTPAWIVSKKFDVSGKIGSASSNALHALPSDQKLSQFRLMVRALLEQRFKLKVSTVQKEFPVYALLLANGGAKAALVPVPAGEVRASLKGLKHRRL